MHATTCLMHVLATVLAIANQLIVASCRPVFWPRVRVFGEAVSMSERSERILTMSEALVLRRPLLFVVCECRRHEPRSCEAARTTKE